MDGALKILAGLSLFMFGIKLVSGGMEKLAGDRIQVWLDRVINGRIKSAIFGATATALIQSSGLLMVTMIGLINANLMTVQQSIGVMLGQEIGTTLTAQIVAFDIGDFKLILVVIGFLILEFSSHRDSKKYGEILLGLGIIFVGMNFMSQALESIATLPWVSKTLVMMGQAPLIGVLAGLILTALVQSSTAVTSLAVAMGISQVITLDGAVGIILGANIGSCVTGFVASIRLSRAARQASIAQIIINVFGVILFLPFIPQFADLVRITSGDLARQIANAHTIFNITVSVILFPFVKQVAQLADRLIVAEAKSDKPKATMYIDEMQFSVPAVALSEANRELMRIGDVTAEMIEKSCDALIHEDVRNAQSVLIQEDIVVDPVSRELEQFINHLLREELNLDQQERCFQIKNILVDIERVGDLAEDIAQYALERVENNIPFSKVAIDDLEKLTCHAYETYSLALEALTNRDADQARRVCRLESEFDRLYGQVRRAHIERLEAGDCQPEANVIFTETLRDLERISDHADNLGISVIRAKIGTGIGDPSYVNNHI